MENALTINEVYSIFNDETTKKTLTVNEYILESICCVNVEKWLNIPTNGIPSRVVIKMSKKFDMKKSQRYANKVKNKARARRPFDHSMFLSVRDSRRLEEKEEKEKNTVKKFID